MKNLENATLHGVSLRIVLLDALHGCDVPIAMHTHPMTLFTGTRWSWHWSELNKVSTDMLAMLYAQAKKTD